MIGTREHKKQNSDTSVPIKSHHTEHISSHNSCGGCNTCHQMTGIHSMIGNPVFGGNGDGDQGSNLQKPCATNFFQRTLGNSYMQFIAENLQIAGQAASKSGMPTIQRKCSCGGSCTGCSGEEELQGDRKSTRLNSSHIPLSRMPSSA